MNLVLIIGNSNQLTIQLRLGNKVVDSEGLTIARNLDTLLIVSLDNLLARNRIDRLSLRTLKIQGKLEAEAVSGMIIRTIKSGLGI